MENVDNPFATQKTKSEKAMKFLGRDCSKEKVMSTLGCNEEHIQQAEQARIERLEEEYERKRELEALNKKESSKALEILGHNPSKEKVMNRLGVDADVVDEALMEVAEREEQRIFRKRRSSGSLKRNAQKALDILGHDPSKEKIMNTLGMDEQDVQDVEKEKIEMYEQECTRKRSNSWLNKRVAAKALKVLGLEPSKDKVMTMLGIMEFEVKEAEEQEWERQEELTQCLIKKRIIQNKKQNSKALRVLGIDPSNSKLQSTFGVDYEILKKYPKDISMSHPTKMAIAIGIPICLMIVTIVLYTLLN